MFQFLIETGGSNVVVAESSSSGMEALWIFGIAVVVILVGAIALTKLIRLLKRPELNGLSREAIEKQWTQILLLPKQGIVGSKLALIEADKLLDGVLKSMMFPGETMADRLKVCAYKYPNIRNVWWAHKLRNQLVHDSSFELTARQAKSALHDYENALKTLNVYG